MKFEKNFGEITIDGKISINSAKTIYEENINDSDERSELLFKLYNHCIECHPKEGLDNALINYCETKRPGLNLNWKKEKFMDWLKEVKGN